MRELVELSEGYQWRERRALERQAWLAHVLLHAWVTNPPSIPDLLGDSATPQDSEKKLETLLGVRDPCEDLAAAVKKQVSRR